MDEEETELEKAQKENQRLKDCMMAGDVAWIEHGDHIAAGHREEVKELKQAFREYRVRAKESKEEMMLEILRSSIGEWQRELLNVYVESIGSN